MLCWAFSRQWIPWERFAGCWPPCSWLPSSASVFFAKSKDCDLGAFIAQSGAAALLNILLAASMFLNFVVASADSVGPAITTMSAASSELTLMWMTIIVRGPTAGAGLSRHHLPHVPRSCEGRGSAHY